jgi:putative nucleotidyltransferase with HDIG domain
VHSLTTASIARLLATRIADADPMDCFIAGLLHDFGKVVIAQFMPLEFRRALESSQWNEIPLHLALRQDIGVDHAEVGAMLVEKWRFPSDLVETIRHQYSPEQMDTSMLACVFAANKISKKLESGVGDPSSLEELPPTMAKHLGGTMSEVIVSLGDLRPVFEEAKLLAKI